MAIQAVGIKRTDYSEITDGIEMKEYILDRVNASGLSVLYVAPAIPATVYTAGSFGFIIL
jgi:hypothetical protein